jgi:hypothetical protein
VYSTAVPQSPGLTFHKENYILGEPSTTETAKSILFNIRKLFSSVTKTGQQSGSRAGAPA